MNTARKLLLAALALGLSTPAAAQMISARNPKAVADLLQQKGYRAELTEIQGEPAIKSGAGGASFTVFFNNCTNGANCTTIAFFTGFTDLDSTHAKLNEWNRVNRFARAYLDSENDPVLAMDVDLDHDGIPAANFNEYLEIWASLMPKYLNYLRAE